MFIKKKARSLLSWNLHFSKLVNQVTKTSTAKQTLLQLHLYLNQFPCPCHCFLDTWVYGSLATLFLGSLSGGRGHCPLYVALFIYGTNENAKQSLGVHVPSRVCMSRLTADSADPISSPDTDRCVPCGVARMSLW